MALYGVVPGSVLPQIKPVGIVDGIYIHIEKNPLLPVCLLKLLLNEVHLVFRAVRNLAAKARLPETMFKVSWKHAAKLCALIKKRYPAYAPGIVSDPLQPLHNRGSLKSKGSGRRHSSHTDILWKKQHASVCNGPGLPWAGQKTCKHGVVGRICKIPRRLALLPRSILIQHRSIPLFFLFLRRVVAQSIQADKKDILLSCHLVHIKGRRFFRAELLKWYVWFQIGPPVLPSRLSSPLPGVCKSCFPGKYPDKADLPVR